jgi:hypothetical protein
MNKENCTHHTIKRVEVRKTPNQYQDVEKEIELLDWCTQKRIIPTEGVCRGCEHYCPKRMTLLEKIRGNQMKNIYHMKDK